MESTPTETKNVNTSNGTAPKMPSKKRVQAPEAPEKKSNADAANASLYAVEQSCRVLDVKLADCTPNGVITAIVPVELVDTAGECGFLDSALNNAVAQLVSAQRQIEEGHNVTKLNIKRTFKNAFVKIVGPAGTFEASGSIKGAPKLSVIEGETVKLRATFVFDVVFEDLKPLAHALKTKGVEITLEDPQQSLGV